jgi:hypothetical protein
MNIQRIYEGVIVITQCLWEHYGSKSNCSSHPMLTIIYGFYGQHVQYFRRIEVSYTLAVVVEKVSLVLQNA